FDSAIEFLKGLPLIIVASCDSQRHLWASLLTGIPGFLEVFDAKTLVVGALPQPDDPLSNNLQLGDALGLLAIDFASRSRLRLNGQLTLQTNDGLHIEANEVFGNCPKYIQAREITLTQDVQRPSNRHNLTNRDTSLSAEQQSWIANADTFFIASAYPGGGADTSHRGGNPGFLRVVNERQLIFPDYSGNMMFNTLGNIAVNPSVGLLFPDFEADRTLQLTGRAVVIWDKDRIASFPGAQRLVAFEVDEVVERRRAIGLQFGSPEYSRFNPR
ncbi:MAG: pyridoxamine 5'-phosphate oxidase family protein, partial [Anaerolineae bacterium]|nr:pyridoxamine 5'-phosphate oxidase family protein [Anaerolineae bacterium]